MTQPGNWYSIGIFTGPSPLALAPAPAARNPVLSYRDVTDVPAVFVADPFLERHDGVWHMFFEILIDGGGYKGEIGLATSEDGFVWEYRGRVLAEPCSLSYPHVFRWQGEHYMLPERYEQNELRLYRAETFPTGWRPVASLLAGGLYADSSIFRHEDRWWILTCPRPLLHDELRLYSSDHLMGLWREHPASPILTADPRNSRPGGRVVEHEGRLLRFAQDCRPRYGAAVRVFEITRLTPSEYSERRIERAPLAAPAAGAWNSRAMHHVDAHPCGGGSWLAAVDGHDHPSYRR